jgi:hypothetical protein
MAQACGASVVVDGRDLLVRASAKPPEQVLFALVRHKQDIIAFLRRELDVTEASNSYNESLDRRLNEWLNQHPAPSTAGQCAWCGKSEAPAAK